VSDYIKPTEFQMREAKKLYDEGWLPISNKYRIIGLAPAEGVYEALGKLYDGRPDAEHWRRLGLEGSRDHLARCGRNTKEGVQYGIYIALKALKGLVNWVGIIWKGKKVTTMGEVSETVAEIAKAGDKKLAEEFINAFVASDKGATVEKVKSNIGYLAGYHSRETAQLIFDVFDCAHPIFGTRAPTPEEAFKKGMELGKAAKKP